jgi:putative Holliday junction resolvase
MAIIALDYGEKRVGVAISYEGILAKRYQTIKYKTEDELLDKIAKICGEEEVRKIIIGLPITLHDRKVGHQAEQVKDFVERLKQDTKKTIILEDETLTTEEAKTNLREEGFSESKILLLLDEEAARIVLQDYLNK